MLESLRAIQNTWVGKAVVAIIMGLIMISFVIWGIGPVFTGFNANTVATVGGSSVSVEAFRQAYQSELQQLQQRARRPITNAQAHQFGLDTQVLSRLVSEAVIDSQARGMGLAISQAQVAKAITSDPDFNGANGQFDRARFNDLLRQNEMTEQGFVREQGNVYLRQELIQGLVGGLVVPEAASDALHRFAAQTRSIDYVTLRAAAAGPIAAPEEAALQKFFDDRAASFRAPEYRKLVILPILPAALAKPDSVSDADVQALYDQVKDKRFTTPEYRTLQQVVFPAEADATAASQAIASGKSFAEVAGDKAVDLGRVTKASIFEKGVAEAAFSLADGATSGPVKSEFGSVIVHVGKVDPAAVQPLAEVAPALRLEIATAHTGDAVRTLHDKVEDGRSSGQNLTDAAKGAGLEVRTVDAVSAAGLDKAGQPVELPNAVALLKAAFASDVGVDNDTVRTPDGGQIFFEVAAIDPARPQTFAEVRPKVEAAWRQDETARLLESKGADLVKAVQGGETIDAVAAAQGVPVQHVADVRRAGGTGLPAAVVAKVFDLPDGGTGTAPGEGDTRVVFKILGDVVPTLDAESPEAKQADARYKETLADDILNIYLNQIQGQIGVKINPTAFSTAIGAN